jgi:hypothetical protein
VGRGGVIVLCDSLYIGIWCVFVTYSNVVFMEGKGRQVVVSVGRLRLPLILIMCTSPRLARNLLHLQHLDIVDQCCCMECIIYFQTKQDICFHYVQPFNIIIQNGN